MVLLWNEGARIAQTIADCQRHRVKRIDEAKAEPCRDLSRLRAEAQTELARKYRIGPAADPSNPNGVPGTYDAQKAVVWSTSVITAPANTEGPKRNQVLASVGTARRLSRDLKGLSNSASVPPRTCSSRP